jgi:hypothetical protein
MLDQVQPVDQDRDTRQADPPQDYGRKPKMVTAYRGQGGLVHIGEILHEMLIKEALCNPR